MKIRLFLLSVLMPCIVAVNVMAADKYTVSINTNGLRNVELADKSSAFLLEPGPHWLGNFPFSIIIGNEPKGSGEWIFVRECSWSLSPNHPKVPPSAEEADVNPKTGDSTTVTLNGYDEWGKMYTLTATVQWTEVNKDTKIQRPGSTPIVATCSIKLLAVRPEATFFVDQPEPGRRTMIKDGKVGHTWWQFSLQPREAVTKALVPPTCQPFVNQPTGYGPKTGVSLAHITDVGKLYNPDNGHAANYSRSFQITISQLVAGLSYTRNLSGTPGTYNLNSNNCTGAAIKAGAAVGIIIPATKQTYFGYGGYNPGDFGEDLRTMPEP